MKIEIDTINDSVDDLQKTLALLQEILEKRTGVTAGGKRVYQTPLEVTKSEPKIIYEDIMRPSRQVQTPLPTQKFDIKKRKVLKQDEHVPNEEEEDEDRFLPKIQYKDFW